MCVGRGWCVGMSFSVCVDNYRIGCVGVFGIVCEWVCVGVCVGVCGCVCECVSVCLCLCVCV